MLANLDRLKLVAKYCWAIPDEGAIKIIKKYGPIVEIGAGGGYWAYVLQQAEVDVIAYDKKPYNNNYCRSKWSRVKYGSAKKAGIFPDRALFLCWPPYNTKMAYNCLKYYTGDTVIYVGEPAGGCTGDGSFFRELNEEWELIEEYKIPK